MEGCFPLLTGSHFKAGQFEKLMLPGARLLL